jgi:hypothetical protein
MRRDVLLLAGCNVMPPSASPQTRMVAADRWVAVSEGAKEDKES